VRTIKRSSEFAADWKRLKAAGYDMSLLRRVVVLLASEGTLPGEFRPHLLRGEWKETLECHVGDDENWLLAYKLSADTLVLLRTGTHDDLFRRRYRPGER
jgi:mRNA interferase YafQ